MFDMGKSSLKRRFQNGETAVGIFITEFRTPNMGVLLDAAGYDFAVFDMEHCSFTNQDLSIMVPSFRGTRCRPLVRVPAVRREFFQSVLDCGVEGIVVPMVESPEQVREAVAMMKYPPEGRRGLSYCCPHASFQERDRDAHVRAANDNVLLVVQIETGLAVERIDEILSVPGVDVAFVGNMDLSLSLGEKNDLEKGPIHDAVQRILRTAKSKGVYGGGNFVRPDLVAQFYEDGLRFISLDSDVERFFAGMKAGLDTVRLGLKEKNAR